MNDDLILEINRRIPAPREAVFAAFIEPEQLARWYGPSVFGNEDVEVDATVGGRFQVVMVAPSGDRYPAGGAFIEIDPPSFPTRSWWWCGRSSTRSAPTPKHPSLRS